MVTVNQYQYFEKYKLIKNYLLNSFFIIFMNIGTHGHFISNFVKNFVTNYFIKPDIYYKNNKVEIFANDNKNAVINNFYILIQYEYWNL